MSFAALHASYSDLRDGLRAQVGRKAIDDLNIRPPAGDEDEASFLRLTAWCFSLLFEAGRYSIPFLLNIKMGEHHVQNAQKPKETREVVQALRSFLSHNLGFDRDHDVSTRRAASDWFVETCGATVPISKGHWATCFQRLSNDVRECIHHCSETLSLVVRSPYEKTLVLGELRRRLERNLEPFEFDQIVQDAAARFGEHINARAFRDRHLPAWRTFLISLPDDADPKLELERLVDGAVAEHFRSIMPIRTQELMDVLELEPGPRVKQAVEVVRGLFESGVRDRDDLISRVRSHFKEMGPTAGG